MRPVRVFLGSIALFAAWGMPLVAAAQSASTATTHATLSALPAPQPNEQESEAASAAAESREAPAPRAHAEERPFSFLLDPTTPSAGDLSVEYALGYASGSAADRPLPRRWRPRARSTR